MFACWQWLTWSRVCKPHLIDRNSPYSLCHTTAPYHFFWDFEQLLSAFLWSQKLYTYAFLITVTDHKILRYLIKMIEFYIIGILLIFAELLYPLCLLSGVLLTGAALEAGGSRSLSSCDAGWLPAFPGSSRHHVSVGWHPVRTGRPARREWGRGCQKADLNLRDTHRASITFWGRGKWKVSDNRVSAEVFLPAQKSEGKMWGRKERL